MLDVVFKWQTLVPGNLPTKHLKMVFRDFNLKHSLASFEFTGFVAMHTMMLPRSRSEAEEYATYLNPSCAEKVVAGRNHYGSVFDIQVGPTFLTLEEYGHDDGACQETSMRLLKHVLLDLQLTCQWQAYSWYYDNHECSPVSRGTEKELCALFDTDRSSQGSGPTPAILAPDRLQRR